MDKMAGKVTNSTQQLARELRNRQPEALGDLMALFGREVQGVAYLILHDHADAEEVVLDTMMAAWRNIGQLRKADSLRAWLLRIAARNALSRQRRIRPVQRLLIEVPSRDFDPLERLALMEALDRLPARMRAAVILHYFADLSVAEVAAALDRSENTVKTQLREALERLRANIKAEGVAGQTKGQERV